MNGLLRQGLLVAVLLLALAGAGVVMLAPPSERVVASFTTSLKGRNRSQRHNAMRALKRLAGAVVEPGARFSFNARVGSFSRDDGYRKAPVSYDGLLIDSWGGGVCQTSTTLYNAALLAGMRIVERHRHEFCPGYVPPGRDAAVAYSDLDLKFVNPYSFPLRIETTAENGALRVDFIADRPLPQPIFIAEEIRNVQRPVEFAIGRRGYGGHVRTSGKPGCDVTVYRICGDKKQMISADSYPAMNRVVDFED